MAEAHRLESATSDRTECDPGDLNHGWKRIVRGFTPSWFTVTMGTGIVSVLLHAIPYRARWLDVLAIIVFILNLCLFALFTLISLIRYTVWPKLWTASFGQSEQSLFLGAFPMSIATLVDMLIYVCAPSWGDWTVRFAWALWWVVVVLSLSVALYVPWTIVNQHNRTSLSSMSAAWLLPIISTIVAAGSGSIVADALINPQHALWTVVMSYVLWGLGVAFAMAIMVIYFQRLALYHLPPKEIIITVFLPLGPLGQGAFGIMQLGKVAMDIFPQTMTLSSNAGEMLYVMGFLVAIVMWSFGLLWLFFALATIVSTRRFPFNIGWWGMTFPLGVYTLSTISLGNELPSRVFRVLGTILATTTILIWLVVATRTAVKAFKGGLFVAPREAGLRKENEVDLQPSV